MPANKQIAPPVFSDPVSAKKRSKPPSTQITPRMNITICILGLTPGSTSNRGSHRNLETVGRILRPSRAFRKLKGSC